MPAVVGAQEVLMEVPFIVAEAHAHSQVTTRDPCSKHWPRRANELQHVATMPYQHLARRPS